MTAGDTERLFPVPTGEPEHDPAYHTTCSLYPPPPPIRLSTVEEPVHKAVESAVADVGLAEGETTVMVTGCEFAEAQSPFLTTARKYVVVVKLPIVAEESVAEAEVISVAVPKLGSVDRCHFTTEPTLLDRLSATGAEPEQIV